ncbi:MAG TPA: redoxin domain-containing protein, partial [Alphaproteobacteria bacterium]|nr:redoxin domain-containing protein [Alphaproteobacteria bacterium]
MADYARVLRGDPAPYFQQRSYANPRYAFDTAAGRYIVLCFFGSASTAHAQAAIAAVRTKPEIFDDETACFFGVSNDPQDETEQRVANSYPGFRFLWDFDLKVSRLYGTAASDAAGEKGSAVLRCRWIVLDPTLRVLTVIPFQKDHSDIGEVLALLESLPPPSRFAGFELQAPVIVLPNVLEPELCEKLIGLYEADGGAESGFMREENGKTVRVTDHGHKRRRDYRIADRDLISALQERFLRRVVPEIAKVHQFQATRMERYIVACYSADDGGHFQPHRDNTTKGTAHRRFAVSVNLNDDYDGGEVRFPEYGPRSFKPPAGGAVV